MITGYRHADLIGTSVAFSAAMLAIMPLTCANVVVLTYHNTNHAVLIDGPTVHV